MIDKDIRACECMGCRAECKYKKEKILCFTCEYAEVIRTFSKDWEYTIFDASKCGNTHRRLYTKCEYYKPRIEVRG